MQILEFFNQEMTRFARLSVLVHMADMPLPIWRTFGDADCRGADVMSGRCLWCFLPCRGRGRCWRLGGRRDWRESLREDLRERPGSPPSVGKQAPRFSSCWIRHEPVCKKKNVDQSSAQPEQGHPDQDGADQRHNAATSWLLHHPRRHFILHHSRRWGQLQTALSCRRGIWRIACLSPPLTLHVPVA